jgi:hypothetical protein
MTLVLEDTMRYVERKSVSLAEKKSPIQQYGKIKDNRNSVAKQMRQQKLMLSHSLLQKKKINFVNTSNGVVQKAIKDIKDWDAFVEAFTVKNNDAPSDMLKSSVEKIIGLEREYSYEDAFALAMDLAMDENAGDLAPQIYYVRVSELVGQLDPEQHRPNLVNYNKDDQTLSQAPVSGGSESLHYGQSRLDDIRNTQLSPQVDEGKIKAIFFEILDKNKEVPITTGDGRHRIAVYNAMGVKWIKAEITGSQLETLGERGITATKAPE